MTNRATDRPVLTVFGGANGAGKSSLAAAFGLPGRFINADEVARDIDAVAPERASARAGRMVLRDLDHAIAAGETLIYETTLSSHQSLALMLQARDAGYQVGLVFVFLRHPDLNVARVAQRVAQGGHHIPEPIIRRRCVSSLDRLVQAIRLAHGTLIFDNSERAGPALVLRIAGTVIEADQLDHGKPMHHRLAAVAAQAKNPSAI